MQKHSGIDAVVSVKGSMMDRLVKESKKLIMDSLSLYWELLKVMIPVMILVRVAVVLGAIEVVGKVVAPVMGWVGLPGEMGFVWVTAIFVNIYAGMVALLTLLPEYPLTIAQATVLGSMILIAHSLPLEQRIVQRSGPGFVFTLVLRIVAALGYGVLLTTIYAGFDAFQQPAQVMFFEVASADQDWLSWAWGSIESLWSIFWIIFILLLALRMLDVLRITPLLSAALSPFLRIMGISEKASSMTITGALLGISYGGALIIQEARTGNLPERDIFLSLSFMCICHSLIEDTLFVMAFGGHYTGLLIGRFVFALLVTMFLAQLINRLSQPIFHRYLFRKTSCQAN